MVMGCVEEGRLQALYVSYLGSLPIDSITKSYIAIFQQDEYKYGMKIGLYGIIYGQLASSAVEIQNSCIRRKVGAFGGDIWSFYRVGNSAIVICKSSHAVLQVTSYWTWLVTLFLDVFGEWRSRSLEMSDIKHISSDGDLHSPRSTFLLLNLRNFRTLLPVSPAISCVGD